MVGHHRESGSAGVLKVPHSTFQKGKQFGQTRKRSSGDRTLSGVRALGDCSLPLSGCRSTCRRVIPRPWLAFHPMSSHLDQANIVRCPQTGHRVSVVTRSSHTKIRTKMPRVFPWGNFRLYHGRQGFRNELVSRNLHTYRTLDMNTNTGVLDSHSRPKLTISRQELF